ncbi:hypothetical protein [Chitinophaga sp. CB10]|uniref:hypothetical protein n=1 Tax=Chitinophaga sp. CB10 TaxID=1891659 RepID=UPI0025BC04E1|nr:hypothetical protein [Chitinophaga sp. CB10]
MVKTLNTPSNSLHKRQGKDKHFEVQMKRVFAAFKRKPSTMLMVSIETGILRANICRYVAKWQKQGSIHQLKQGLCKVSKHRAGYYTTNTNLFTQPLKLF